MWIFINFPPILVIRGELLIPTWSSTLETSSPLLGPGMYPSDGKCSWHPIHIQAFVPDGVSQISAAGLEHFPSPFHSPSSPSVGKSVERFKLNLTSIYNELRGRGKIGKIFLSSLNVFRGNPQYSPLWLGSSSAPTHYSHPALGTRS